MHLRRGHFYLPCLGIDTFYLTFALTNLVLSIAPNSEFAGDFPTAFKAVTPKGQG